MVIGVNVEIRLIDEITPDLLNTLAQWLYQWWGKEEGYSFDAVSDYLYHSVNRDKLPLTFGCFEHAHMVGMYQFQMGDLFVRPNLYPWLANVYVDPQYRNCGYGDAMLKSVGNMLRQHTSFRECFLYTVHVNFYEKYHWKFVSEIDTFLKNYRIQRLYQLSLLD